MWRILMLKLVVYLNLTWSIVVIQTIMEENTSGESGECWCSNWLFDWARHGVQYWYRQLWKREHIRKLWRILTFKVIVCLSLTWTTVVIQTIMEERERTYEEMGENTDVQTGCLSKPNMEYNSDTNNQGRERENIWGEGGECWCSNWLFVWANMEYSCDTNNHGREHIRRWWRILMFKLVVCLSLTWSRVVIQTTVKERTHQEKGENADV